MKTRVLLAACASSVLALFSSVDAQNTDSAAKVPGAVATQKPVAYPGSETKNQGYRIGFQDALEIQVFRHPELTQRVNVSPNGTISLFRLDAPLTAVCKTEGELAADVTEAYRKDYLRNPEVKVFTIEQRSQAFAVIGAVEKPGSFFVNRRVRLLELLALAGGPSKEAGTRLLVARTGSTSNCKMNEDAAANSDDITLMDFKIDDVLSAKQNLEMRPGDIVSVLDADVVYVYGHVNKQGQVPIRQPLTLTQAIASAEGLEAAARRDVIRVLRQKPGTLEREELVYNLKDIDARKVEDPYLLPNDVVAVSQDKMKSILNSIGKSLTSGVSTIFYRVP